MKTKEQLRLEYEHGAGKPSKIKRTDGVHCVLIECFSDEYVEWLETELGAVATVGDTINKIENDFQSYLLNHELSEEEKKAAEKCKEWLKRMVCVR